MARTHTALRRARTAIRPVKVRIAASPNGPMRSAFSAPRGAARPGRSGTQCPWFDPGGGFHTAERRKMPRFVGGLRSTSPCTRGVRHDCVRSPSSCGTSIPMEGFAHDAPAAASLLRRAPEHTGGCAYFMSTGRECQVSTAVATLKGSMVGRGDRELRTGYAQKRTRLGKISELWRSPSPPVQCFRVSRTEAKVNKNKHFRTSCDAARHPALLVNPFL